MQHEWLRLRPHKPNPKPEKATETEPEPGQSQSPSVSFTHNPSEILRASPGCKVTPWNIIHTPQQAGSKLHAACCMLQASRSFHFASHNYVKLVSVPLPVPLPVQHPRRAFPAPWPWRIQARLHVQDAPNFPTPLGKLEIVFKCSARGKSKHFLIELENGNGSATRL